MARNIEEADGKQLDADGAAWLAKNLRDLAEQVERESTYLVSASFAAKVVEVPCPGTCGSCCRVVHREALPGYESAHVSLRWGA